MSEALATWLLVITIGGSDMVAGEYQSMERCERAAKMQLPHWRKVDSKLVWRCEGPKGRTNVEIIKPLEGVTIFDRCRVCE